MGITRLVGENYTTPDLLAKVTGQAKYAEDFRVEGMLFTKLLLSPLPHARVLSVDTSAAEAMPGYRGILRAGELPAPADTVTDLGETIRANPLGERALTDEPVYAGEPVLAVAAVDEETAAAAIEAIRVEWEPLPFVVDPLESLFPGGPNARTTGNVVSQGQVSDFKWTPQDFAEAGENQLPMGKPATEWSYGDLDAGFSAARVVLDETFITQGMAHHSMEPRTAMAYWQNGKCYLHAS